MPALILSPTKVCTMQLATFSRLTAIRRQAESLCCVTPMLKHTAGRVCKNVCAGRSVHIVAVGNMNLARNVHVVPGKICVPWQVVYMLLSLSRGFGTGKECTCC